MIEFTMYAFGIAHVLVYALAFLNANAPAESDAAWAENGL
jgi:hypothetical protein